MKEPNNDPSRKKWLDTKKARQAVRRYTRHYYLTDTGVPVMEFRYHGQTYQEIPVYHPFSRLRDGYHFGNGTAADHFIGSHGGRYIPYGKSSRRMMRLKTQWRQEALERIEHE